jgi:hypothetical protein
MSTKSVALGAFVLATCLSSAAFAGDQPINPAVNPNITRQIPGGLWDPSLSMCPAGWVANPAHIDPNNPYGQSYTCTGPRIVCNRYFKPVPPIVGSVPGTAPPGQFAIPTNFYGSPVIILPNGHMQYTCAEPPPPPR